MKIWAWITFCASLETSSYLPVHNNYTHLLCEVNVTCLDWMQRLFYLNTDLTSGVLGQCVFIILKEHRVIAQMYAWWRTKDTVAHFISSGISILHLSSMWSSSQGMFEARPWVCCLWDSAGLFFFFLKSQGGEDVIPDVVSGHCGHHVKRFICSSYSTAAWCDMIQSHKENRPVQPCSYTLVSHCLRIF